MCLYTLERALCVAIASLLHYFILATFSWMFIMALIQYLLFVKVFPSTVSAFTRKAAAFSQCKSTDEHHRIHSLIITF